MCQGVNKMETSEKLKLLRKTENITQVKMAELLEITENGYQKLEYGRTEPTHKVISRLCKLFPEYTLWLMTDEINPPHQIDPYIKQTQSSKTG